MTEQRQRIENVLRACAEHRVPETVDPWPRIRARLDERAAPELRRSTWRVPRSRVGWALVALLVVLFGMGAYAASGLLYTMFRDELPGATQPVYGEKLNLQQTADGARVTLQWAYADQDSVVVGFGIEDLEEDRRVDAYPARLDPVLDPPSRRAVEQRGGYGDWPAEPELTGEGDGFTTDSTTWNGADEAPTIVVFNARNRLESGTEHRFRLEVPVQARPHKPGGTTVREERPTPEPVGGRPFVFDFEVPVRPAPVIELDQQETANGITLTLDRVVNSPGRPAARICFEPPDDTHAWFVGTVDGMFVEAHLIPGSNGERRCQEVLLREPLDQHASITIADLEGMPLQGTYQGEKEFGEKFRTIHGPWTFEFEVPER